MKSHNAAGKSYRKCKWLSLQPLQKTARGKFLTMLFNKRKIKQDLEPGNGVAPEWLQVERVIGKRDAQSGTEYLVKWRDLPYTETTWETEAELKEDKVNCCISHKSFSQFSSYCLSVQGN